MNSTTICAPLLSAAVLALTVGSTFAQQTTGSPGSPSATTTIDGKYLPPPPAPFGGTINLDAKDSKAVGDGHQHREDDDVNQPLEKLAVVHRPDAGNKSQHRSG